MALSQDVERIRALLAKHPTLYDAARTMTGARPIAGRTTAYAIHVDGSEWIVRHYVRGGAIAPVLGDKYARLVSRSFRELEVSAAVRARGVPTPIVIAAAEYPAGAFLRFDIVLQYIQGAHDLAAVIFDQPAAAEPAARAIRAAIAGGLVHADLNLKNILVTETDGWIIDLDRARMVRTVDKSAAFAMRARLIRSLEKWQGKIGRTVSADARATLEQAFDV